LDIHHFEKRFFLNLKLTGNIAFTWQKSDWNSIYIDITTSDLCSVTVQTSWQNPFLLIRINMGVHHCLMTWFFIFQLLSLAIALIEASRNIEESHLDLNDRVSEIEAKDRYQDGEMALLKNALDEERKLVHDLTNRVAILEGPNNNSPRQKRPYRLLPPHIPR